MLRLAFDFIITWRETRTRPNAYTPHLCYYFHCTYILHFASRHVLHTPILFLLEGGKFYQ